MSYISTSSEKLSRHIGAASTPNLVDARIDEDRAADLRTRQDGRQHELASTRGTFGTTIRWRTP